MAFYDESPYAPAYQHRAMVSGKNGAVAAASPQAAIAGLKVLQNGGNAVDAACALLFAPDAAHRGIDQAALGIGQAVLLARHLAYDRLPSPLPDPSCRLQESRVVTKEYIGAGSWELGAGGSELGAGGAGSL